MYLGNIYYLCYKSTALTKKEEISAICGRTIIIKCKVISLTAVRTNISHDCYLYSLRYVYIHNDNCFKCIQIWLTLAGFSNITYTNFKIYLKRK